MPALRCHRRRAKSGRRSSSNVAWSQLATTHGVIAVTVAVRGTCIVSATSPKNSPARRICRSPIADCETPATPGDQHVEAVAGLALADERRARRDLFAAHPVGELGERLAGQSREQPDARELGHGRGNVPRRHAAVRYPRGSPDSWRYCPRCASELQHEDGRVECPACGFTWFAASFPTASAFVFDDRGKHPPRAPGARAGRRQVGRAGRIPGGGRAPDRRAPA